MKKINFLTYCINVFALLLGIMIPVSAQTWTSTNGPFRPHEIRDLSASLNGGVQTIYVADVETLKYTTNGGTSWFNTGYLMLNPLVVLSKPDNPSIVHVGKAGKLYYSGDGGTS